MDAERYARQLKGTILFRNIDEAWIRAWLKKSDVLVSEYENGEYLFRKGDTADRIGILLRGSADVSRFSSDGSMHMSTLKKNDLFGAASLCSENDAYVTNIRCKEPCRALLIPEETMLALLSENKTVLRNYLGYLNSRIRFLNNRLDALSKNTVASRVLTFLESEAVDRVYHSNSITKLSDSLCISRATLYRAIDALEKEGKIIKNGKEIILTEESET